MYQWPAASRPSAFLPAAERLLDITISTAACSTLPLQSDEIGPLQAAASLDWT
jgi:hypothetical protein